jgi:hypothetical protein
MDDLSAIALMERIECVISVERCENENGSIRFVFPRFAFPKLVSNFLGRHRFGWVERVSGRERRHHSEVQCRWSTSPEEQRVPAARHKGMLLNVFDLNYLYFFSSFRLKFASHSADRGWRGQSQPAGLWLRVHGPRGRIRRLRGPGRRHAARLAIEGVTRMRRLIVLIVFVLRVFELVLLLLLCVFSHCALFLTR